MHLTIICDGVRREHATTGKTLLDELARLRAMFGLHPHTYVSLLRMHIGKAAEHLSLIHDITDQCHDGDTLMLAYVAKKDGSPVIGKGTLFDQLADE